MGYKNYERQKQYQREWMRRRREEWFNGRNCLKCGATEDLQIDHRDPTKKVDHKIFAWTQKRRDRELKKCQVLCKSCHLTKSEDNLEGPYRYSKEVVAEVRKLRAAGLSFTQIANQTGVSRSQAHRITHGEQRKL